MPGSATADGTQLEIRDCNAGANQEFTLTASGTVVDLYTCNGDANQRWSLT